MYIPYFIFAILIVIFFVYHRHVCHDANTSTMREQNLRIEQRDLADIASLDSFPKDFRATKEFCHQYQTDLSVRHNLKSAEGDFATAREHLRLSNVAEAAMMARSARRQLMYARENVETLISRAESARLLA